MIFRYGETLCLNTDSLWDLGNAFIEYSQYGGVSPTKTPMMHFIYVCVTGDGTTDWNPTAG